MTGPTFPPPAAAARLHTLDRLRGLAVMGILLMNIVAFSMPEAAYFNPRAWGGESPADLAVWALAFLFVDGKMRGLFALLFGAGLVLMLERAEDDPAAARTRQLARSLWLGLFGLAHYLLLWWGDILALYAVVGLLARPLADQPPATLTKLALAAFALHFLILVSLVLGIHQAEALAAAPGAPAERIAHFGRLLDSIGRPGSPALLQEVALHRGPWSALVADKAHTIGEWATSALHYSTFDTLGFMLLGMAMLKSGFLTGAWPRRRYRTVARLGLAVGLPPMAALAFLAWASAFAPVRTFDIVFAWSFPFRVPLAVALTALAILAMGGERAKGFAARVEAVGRLSLSNYLGTSLLMTGLFYGWGFGLFGHLSRAQVYALVPAVWALMLLWSPPWNARFRHGPMEWLWRSLTRRQWQPMLRRR